MIRIALITASTRVHRRGEQIADWTLEVARQVALPDVEVTPLDLADYALPVLDEPAPAAYGIYAHEHTKRWAAAIDSADGYLVVTPEYNHGVPGALKNAIDYLFYEWNDKAIGFVSYGAAGGVRAVEQLRQIAAELKLADVRAQVSFNTFSDFDYAGSDLEDPSITGRLIPQQHHADNLTDLLDQITAWSRALTTIRSQASAG
jgi:NAD(P)H-dependent FMN reductase